MQEMKCFRCDGWGHLARNCRIEKKKKEVVLQQSQNRFAMLTRAIEMSGCSLYRGDILREVTVKIRLERIETQEEITVEVLLDSGATGLVISSEFAKKKRFKPKKIDRLIYVRNVDRSFKKKRLIEHMVEVNIYYKGHRKIMKINVIRGQTWSMILGIPWLTHHNPEIDQKMGEIKMTRCLEECGRKWRPKQDKSGWQK